MKGCVDMKQVRFVAGMLSAAMLVGIPGTLKVAAADLPAASVDSGVSYATTKSEKVKVTADSLNIRKSADNKSDIVGLLHKGDTCTIVDTKKDSRGVTWGKLEGNKGWINLDFTDAASSFQSYEVKVTAGSLNVRQSANSNSKVVSTLKKGDKVITAGGIYGVVAEVDERTVLIKVDGETKLRVDKSSIQKDMSEAPAQNDKK